MKGEIRDTREVVREEMLMMDKIINVLQEGPKTVPEIAGAIGYPAYEVMFWIMGLRKYGHVSETGEATDEGYYKYKAIVKEMN